MTYTPADHYDYCTDIKDGKTGKDVFVQFECQVEVNQIGDGPDGRPQFEVRGVYVDGFNLFNGDGLSVLIANRIAAEADADIRDGGGLWDDIAEREGLSLTGHPNDPDTHWQIAAQ